VVAITLFNVNDKNRGVGDASVYDECCIFWKRDGDMTRNGDDYDIPLHQDVNE
jgi:hypothetical protein